MTGGTRSATNTPPRNMSKATKRRFPFQKLFTYIFLLLSSSALQLPGFMTRIKKQNREIQGDA